MPIDFVINVIINKEKTNTKWEMAKDVIKKFTKKEIRVIDTNIKKIVYLTSNQIYTYFKVQLLFHISYLQNE